ncbi:MAG: cation transporter [Bacteroidota bacterium]|jgi:divalent metal cation (Fe/Co/Zn/Cd) transporter
MEINTPALPTDLSRFYRIALGLAVFTILYNIAEGLVSMYFGYRDESLALFGFGADSFIEVLSGFGIAHMVLRVQKNPQSNRDDFERTALRVTGYAFYMLVIGLAATSMYNLWIGHKPETTLWGVIIALISIAVMWVLVIRKRKVGRKLNSAAILADVECTKVCIYMSLILLFSSGVYELTRFAFMDTLGTLGLVYLSFKEGRECFKKAKGNNHCSCENE